MACANPQPIGPKSFGNCRPCGVCIECRLNYSRSKAVRCLHELQFWDSASFITLTYDPDSLPFNDGAILPTLVKRDLQLFWKRLRKKLGRPISYMACGEYGDERQRPHYHAILFGEDFQSDREFYKTDNGISLYTSETLSDVWQHQGMCVIGDVTFDSANYVAGYTVKKLSGKLAIEQYDDLGRIPPFGAMSKNPAIGKRWIEKYLDEAVQFDTVIVNGAEQMLPRYYDEYLKKWCPQTYKDIKSKRVSDAQHRLEHNVVASPSVKAKVKQNKFLKKSSKI